MLAKYTRAALLFIVIAFAVLIVPAYAQSDSRFPPTIPDVRYVEDGDFKQKVDIFLPEEGEAPFPTLLLLHGNGYTKWDMQPLAEYFVMQGYAAISIEYRNPAAQFSQDVFCALAWTHANAATYGFDATRLVVLGHSMGGYGAALLGVADDVDEYMENCAHELPAEDRLLGVILYAGGGLEMLLDQIDGSEPPFLLVHGEDDSRVRPSRSEDFAAVLQENGVETTLVLLPEVGHFFTDPESEPGGQAIEAVQLFLDELFDLETGAAE